MVGEYRAFAEMSDAGAKISPVAKMDRDWAIKELQDFLHATQQEVPDIPGVAYFGTVMKCSQAEAAQRAHVVEKILDRGLPEWRKAPRPKHPDSDWTFHREWASRCRAALEREEELAERLGDGAPEMDASNLHPWVWDSAAALWRTEHFALAVGQAAMRVNAETQAKAGRRDLSETDLFNQVFSTKEPKTNEPRLRLMANDGSKIYESVHRGARALAEGLYAGIRNPIAHEVGTVSPEQNALEHLAGFSILARWVDAATVETD